MTEFFSNLFHKHTIVWTKRELVENTTLDFTTDLITDMQPARTYLYTGRCITCGKEPIQVIRTIAEIFDREQPYDIET